MYYTFFSVFYLFSFPKINGYSAFDCRGQGAWELNVSDNAIQTERIQNWLAYRQNRCLPNEKVDYYTLTNNFGGIGSSVMNSVVNFMKSLELNQIYAPNAYWVWGYNNASQCSRNMLSVDCFSQPLTNCEPKTGLSSLPNSINITEANALINGPSDICQLGIHTKKPIVWVFGQLFIYHLRLPYHSAHKVHHDITTALHLLRTAPNPNPQQYTCLTAALHVRTGHLDWGRHAFDGIAHINELTKINEELKIKNQQHICGVYISALNINDTIFQNFTLGKWNFAYGFTFLIYERFTGDPNMEVEYQFAQWKNKPNFDPLPVYLEYIMDIGIFNEVDIFIGSHSNVVHFAASMRYALHPEYPNNHTCWLDSRNHDLPSCLGTWDAVVFWRQVVGGFNGGAIFFDG
jgi:hypothetical protein